MKQLNQNDWALNSQLMQLNDMPKYKEFLAMPQVPMAIHTSKFNPVFFFFSIFYLVYYKLWGAMAFFGLLFLTSIMFIGTVMPAIFPNIDPMATSVIAFAFTQFLMSFWIVDFYHAKATSIWTKYQDMQYVEKVIEPFSLGVYIPAVLVSLVGFSILFNIFYIMIVSVSTVASIRMQPIPVQKQATIQEHLTPNAQSASAPIDLERLKEKEDK